MKRVRKGLLFTIVVLLVLLVVATGAFAAPKRVLIVVMDQMHPEYAKQYNMTNVLWLMNNGANFQNAIVGDMASETVVSHNVMVSGMLPKHQGWSDEAFRDTGGVLGAYRLAQRHLRDRRPRLRATSPLSSPPAATRSWVRTCTTAYPGSTVACVGEKSYQVRSMTAGSADFGVYLGSTSSTDPAW